MKKISRMGVSEMAIQRFSVCFLSTVSISRYLPCSNCILICILISISVHRVIFMLHVLQFSRSELGLGLSLRLVLPCTILYAVGMHCMRDVVMHFVKVKKAEIQARQLVSRVLTACWRPSFLYSGLNMTCCHCP